MSDAVHFLLIVATGFVTGVLSGMFGIGGAVVSAPAIRALGATPFEVIGSTLPSTIPSSISGSLRYHRDGFVHLRTVALTGGPGMAGAVAGSLLSAQVPGDGHLLMLGTAGLVGFTALRMLGPPGPRPEPVADDLAELAEVPAGPRRDTPGRLAATGITAGTLSGLLGIGGGVVMVPMFTGWIRMPLKESLGTSLACVGVLAVPGTITHVALGHGSWVYAIGLTIGVVPGARVGAELALRSSERTLRRVVAVFLGAVAVTYAVGEALALVS